MCIWNNKNKGSKHIQEEKNEPVVEKNLEIKSDQPPPQPKTIHNETVSTTNITINASEVQKGSKDPLQLDHYTTTVDSLDSEQLYDNPHPIPDPNRKNPNAPPLQQYVTTVDSLDSEQLYDNHNVIIPHIEPHQNPHNLIAHVLVGHPSNIHNEALLVQEWLNDVVGLAQYYDNFITNGFESLDLIRSIAEISDLNDINIIFPLHQTKLMNEINKLNAIYSPDNNLTPVANYNYIDMNADKSDDIYADKDVNKKNPQIQKPDTTHYDHELQKKKATNYYDREAQKKNITAEETIQKQQKLADIQSDSGDINEMFVDLDANRSSSVDYNGPMHYVNDTKKGDNKQAHVTLDYYDRNKTVPDRKEKEMFEEDEDGFVNLVNFDADTGQNVDLNKEEIRIQVAKEPAEQYSDSGDSAEMFVPEDENNEPLVDFNGPMHYVNDTKQDKQKAVTMDYYDRNKVNEMNKAQAINSNMQVFSDVQYNEHESKKMQLFSEYLGDDIKDEQYGKEPGLQLSAVSTNMLGEGDVVEKVTVCMVKEWLTHVVCLPQYYDTFVFNGYERLDIIREIEDLEDLEGIGIDNKQHRIKILNEVRQLSAHPHNIQAVSQPSPVELDKKITVEGPQNAYETW